MKFLYALDLKPSKSFMILKENQYMESQSGKFLSDGRQALLAYLILLLCKKLKIRIKLEFLLCY